MTQEPKSPMAIIRPLTFGEKLALAAASLAIQGLPSDLQQASNAYDMQAMLVDPSSVGRGQYILCQAFHVSIRFSGFSSKRLIKMHSTRRRARTATSSLRKRSRRTRWKLRRPKLSPRRPRAKRWRQGSPLRVSAPDGQRARLGANAEPRRRLPTVGIIWVSRQPTRFSA